MSGFIRNAKDFSPISEKRRNGWRVLSKQLNDMGVGAMQIANTLTVSEMTAMMILKNDAAYVELSNEQFDGLAQLTGLSAGFWKQQFLN